MKFIEFNPLYKERIWGGRRFNNHLGRTLPDEQAYGESWDIVDREEAQSIVSKGTWQGLTIRQLLEEQSNYIMGPHWLSHKRFPILVKWLDCRERLSIQVHPPKELQELLGGESKTENWYIVEADPGASVFAGLQENVTQATFLDTLKKGNPEPYLHRIYTTPGDSLFIPSGRLHAIAEGNLILEIQENSDTTYRVYDWGRLGSDGKLRELHIEKSLLSINFNDIKPSKIPASSQNATLADCPEFRIQKIYLQDSLEIPSHQQPRILSIVEGSLKITDSHSNTVLSRGTNILLPYSEYFTLESAKDCTILLIDQFL